MSITLHCGMVYRNAEAFLNESAVKYHLMNTVSLPQYLLCLSGLLYQCWKHSGGRKGEKNNNQDNKNKLSRIYMVDPCLVTRRPPRAGG